MVRRRSTRRAQLPRELVLDETLVHEALTLLESSPLAAPDSIEHDVAMSLAFLFDRRPTFGLAAKIARAVREPPAESRLHEILMELLARDVSSVGPGQIARAHLRTIGETLLAADSAKALRFISYSEREDFLSAVRCYVLRTSLQGMTHADAFAKMPSKHHVTATRLFGDLPHVMGGA